MGSCGCFPTLEPGGAWGTPGKACKFCPTSKVCLVLMFQSYKGQGSVLLAACSSSGF